MKNLYVAFCGEGSTDERLFRELTARLIDHILLERNLTTELSWLPLKKLSGSSEQALLGAASGAKEQHVLIFHRDADCSSRDKCLQNHFDRGLRKIWETDTDKRIKHIIPAIPVQESEAWMLCDKALLRELIETDLTNQQLKLTYKVQHVESIKDPKAVIERAIVLHKKQLPPRKRKLAVELPDLYERFGTEVQIAKLMQIPSCATYERDLRDVLKVVFDEAK